ncbi:MAG: DUF805 domain-containing protein [Bacteroidales bacterium]|nr:DUF805 domain-containing protein [Bacteroidales bacterium]
MVAKPQMSFVDAVKTVVLEKYCCFEGRARRSEYWWFTLANMGVSILTQGLMKAGVLGIILACVICFALFLPSIGVSVRRLHDIGKSGLYLLVAFIPLVGAFVLIYWSVLDSQVGANEYGPSPKYVDENVQ